MSTMPQWCPDDQPHEPHTWTRAIGPGIRGVESLRCPGVEELPEVACPDDLPHETHQWRTDTNQPLLQCPGRETGPPEDEHELTFLWAAGSAHPVAVHCSCGDRFTVEGP